LRESKRLSQTNLRRTPLPLSSVLFLRVHPNQRLSSTTCSSRLQRTLEQNKKQEKKKRKNAVSYLPLFFFGTPSCHTKRPRELRRHAVATQPRLRPPAASRFDALAILGSRPDWAYLVSRADGLYLGSMSSVRGLRWPTLRPIVPSTPLVCPSSSAKTDVIRPPLLSAWNSKPISAIILAIWLPVHARPGFTFA